MTDTTQQQQQPAAGLTKAEVEAIVQSALLEFTEVVKTYVDDVTTATPAADDSNSTSDPLAERLKLLEQKLAAAEKAESDRQAENSRLRFEAEVGRVVSTFKPEFPDEVKETLLQRMKDATEADGKWLVGGKTVEEYATEFFSTPFGKHLLPPSVASGADTKQPDKQQPIDSSTIASAFL